MVTCLPVERSKGTADARGEDDGCFPTPSNVEEVCPPFWGDKTPPVILISLDGFRPEYLTRTFPGSNPFPVVPTIQCMAKKGVHAPSMMPSYPTITFPNHYSIVTVRTLFWHLKSNPSSDCIEFYWRRVCTQNRTASLAISSTTPT